MKSFFVKYIDCPFCEVRNNVNTVLHEGQVGVCANCQTSFKVAGVKGEKALTRVVEEHKIKMQIDDKFVKISLMKIKELLDRGLMKPYTNETGERIWILTDEGEKTIRNLPEASK